MLLREQPLRTGKLLAVNNPAPFAKPTAKPRSRRKGTVPKRSRSRSVAKKTNNINNQPNNININDSSRSSCNSAAKPGLLGFLLDYEHGSKHNQVPASWQCELTSLYALSSFGFWVVGIYLFWLLTTHPTKQLYPGEHFELVIWLWQGFVSFFCDAVYLGKPSISHPIDRITAICFTLAQVIKFFCSYTSGAFDSCPYVMLPFFAGLSGALYCFLKSAKGVDDLDSGAFFFWHTLWHFAIPITGMSFHTAHVMYS